MSILQIGIAAPIFSSIDDAGKIFNLSDYLYKTNIILYFYPKDDTPGCSLQAKDFRDNLENFKNIDTLIIGISMDDIISHINFRKKYCLPFMLIADENGDICKLYGAYNLAKELPKRASFLIDKTAIIRSIWYDVSVSGHVKDILRSASILQDLDKKQ